MAASYTSRFHGSVIVTSGGERHLLSNEMFVDAGQDGEVFRVGDMAVKVYSENPISRQKREKLMTLCAQRGRFHRCVVAPVEMVRLEGHSSDKAAGFTMEFLPFARQLDAIRWQPDMSVEEEKIFDRTVAAILCQLCEALQSLHANRVFVCDLKPLNVLLCELRPYIVDFDSCALPGYAGESFTVEYLDPRIRDSVPEAMGANEQFSAESDWWALGVIAFKLFMGVSPWAGIHPDFRRQPHIYRSFNYSAVLFDPRVRPPSVGLRDAAWLDARPKLRRYFQGIFSADPSARVPIAPALDIYFPRGEESDGAASRAAAAVMERLAIDPRELEFTRSIRDEIVRRSPRESEEREEVLVRFLDGMFGADVEQEGEGP